MVNQGVIKARDGGYVALVAATVLNEGTLQANGGGTVALAAGDGARLEFGDGRLVNIQVDPATIKTLVENKQLIQAEGGRVLMTAVAASRLQGAVINNAGAVEAHSITSEGGVIRLTGAGEITNTGTMDASGKTAGGTVEIAADTVAADSSAQHPSLVRQAGIVKADALSGKGGKIMLTGEHLQLDKDSLTTATGTSGGGEIYAGGGKHGAPLSKPSQTDSVSKTESVLVNAKSIRVEKGAVLDASATGNGNGGVIVAWGNDAARAYGTFKSKGGPNGGNGGWVETSGHWLNVDGIKVDTKAPQGKSGEWLLDPWDVEITGSRSNTVSVDSGGRTTWTPSGAGSPAQILNTDIQNALLSNHVTIETTAIPPAPPGTESGDITVSSPITWSTDKILTLQADRNINVNATLNATGNAAGLTLNAASNININSPVATPGNSPINLTGNLARLTLSHGAAAGNGYFLNNGARITISGNTPVLQIGKSGGLVSYTVINHLGVEADATTPPLLPSLQGIKTNLIGNYALGSDINASATSGWNDVAGVKQGFTPIGSGTTSATAFTGNFEGLGHTIDRLFINRPSTDNVGLFGTVGLDSGTPNSISHVGLTNANVTGGSDVGILAGQTLPVTSVAHTFSGGKVSGNSFGIGGLIGYNQAGKNGDVSSSLSNSFSTAAVTGVSGTFAVGGLVGWNLGSVTQTYSHGAVQGDAWVGGLIGALTGRTVSSSYSTGSVSGTASVGGLVGNVDSGANIYSSYSMGAVTGTTRAVGGLVGTLSAGGNGFIHDSYSTGAVSGPTGLTGGLVGEVSPGSAIYFSYWDTDTSGTTKGIGSGTPSGTSTLTGLSHSAMMNAASFPGTWSTVGWTLPVGVGVGIYYPYLTWRFPTTPQVISGTLTGAAGGETIKAAQQGQLLDYFPATYRDQPQASVGASINPTDPSVNGFYYFALNAPAATPGGIASGNSVLVYQNAAPTPTGAVRKSDGNNLLTLDLIPNQLSVSSQTPDKSISSSDIATAVGTLTGTPYSATAGNITVNGNAALVTAGLTNFNLGGNITTTDANQTYNSTVTLTGNATLSSGSGRISFGASALGVSVTGAHNLTLNTTTDFTQAVPLPNAPGALQVSGLELLGAGTKYTLTNAANVTGTLAGNTGSVVLQNNGPLTVGTVNTAGLTTTTIDGVNLQTVGGGGDISVNNTITSDGPVTLRTSGSGTNENIDLNATINAAANDVTIESNTAGSNLDTHSADINAHGNITGVNILLSADINKNKGNVLGGKVDNPVTAIINPSGTLKIYTAKTADTIQGYSGFTNGSGSFRYNKENGNTPGAPSVGDGFHYLLYREQPTITVAGTNNSHTYNGEVPVPAVGFTMQNAKNGDTNTQVFSTLPSYEVVGLTKNAGTYTVNRTDGVEQLGYAVSYDTVSFFIDKLAVTLSASAATKFYDGLTTIVGAVPAVSANVALGSGDTLQASAFSFAYDNKNAGVGNKTVYSTLGAASIRDASNADMTGNYAISTNGTGSYVGDVVNTRSTIAPASLKLRANDQFKLFGTAFIFTGQEFTPTGLQNNETIGTVTLASAGAPASADVGNYPINITPGSASGGTFTPSNYTIAYLPGNMTVSQTSLVLDLTANNQIKTYGTNFIFTGTEFTAAGLANGDTINTVQLTSAGAPALANVGNFPIIITPGSAVGSFNPNNYTITYFNGTLTIDPANLTVTANGQVKTYDGLSYSGGNGVVYSGFVLGENSSVLNGTLTYSGTSQGARNVGSYLITPGGQTATNYTIGHVSGTLGITPATLYLSALPDSKIYDGNTSSSKTPVYLGLLPGDSLSRLSQSFNSKEVGDRLLNVDSGYTIYDANAGNNYSVDSRFARGVIIPPPPPVFGSFIAQEIEPKLGPRYVANSPGNGIVSGEAVADVGGEVLGGEVAMANAGGSVDVGGEVAMSNARGAVDVRGKVAAAYAGGEVGSNRGKKVIGSLRKLSNWLTLPEKSAAWWLPSISSADLRNVGPQEILHRLILRSSNPMRALKYWQEYGFDPFGTNSVKYYSNKVDSGKTADGIISGKEVASWLIDVSDPEIPVLKKIPDPKNN
ncbi:MAG: MBG domain-containing protein [Proteobacteria bacterium]|nr:MBG domain-containing protein [Pseudomonadota bacterium]